MARTFNGDTANYLSASTLPLSTLPLTMACWAYVDDVTEGHTLMAFDDAPSGSQVLRLTAQGNGAGDPIRCQLGGSGIDHINDTGAYSSGVWFHAAGTFSAASVDAYLNGVVGSDVATTGTPVFPAPNRFALGVRVFSSATQPLSGRLAWPCIWNVALTAAEIAALAKGEHPYTVRPGNIVSFWRLTGASDAGEVDQIGGSDLSESGTVGVAESNLVSLGWPLNVTRTAASGPAPNIAFGVDFDGTNDYLLRGAALTGSANGKVGTMSFWIRTAVKNFIIFQCSNEVFNISVNASGFLRVLLHNPPEVTLDVVDMTGTTDISNNVWRHVLIAWDTDTPIASMYLDDVLEASDTPESAQLVGQNADDWAVGVRKFTLGSKMNACFGELYWIQSYVGALATESNRRKFRSASGAPVSLGADGSTPTGVQPVVYLSGGAAQFGTNFGSGGNFTVTGTLVDCALPSGGAATFNHSVPVIATATPAQTKRVSKLLGVTATGTGIVSKIQDAVVALQAIATATATLLRTVLKPSSLTATATGIELRTVLMQLAVTGTTVHTNNKLILSALGDLLVTATPTNTPGKIFNLVLNALVVTATAIVTPTFIDALDNIRGLWRRLGTSIRGKTK